MNGDSKIEPDRYVESECLRLLHENPDFKVLRKIKPEPVQRQEDAPDVLIGVVVDVETTGLDFETDEVIEIAMTKFQFDRSGKILRKIDIFQSFREPSGSIPEFISDLTGIQDADVVGQSIPLAQMEEFLDGVAIVIAHNASFDRPFCEGLSSNFAALPWACTATEIPWRAEGIAGGRLEYVAASLGCFYEAHRALDDCEALLYLLSLPLPRSQIVVLAKLLESARQTRARIFAEGAPFDMKGTLKKNGYHWNSGDNGLPKAWWKEVSPGDIELELGFLKELAVGREIFPSTYKTTARTRFRRYPVEALR